MPPYTFCKTRLMLTLSHFPCRIPELIERAKKLKVTGGFEPDADVGPMITMEARKRCEDLIQSGVEEGATLLLDGRDVHVPKYPRGNFVGPTVLADVQTSMRCYQEEIFGPVLLILCVDSMEEAIDVINRNRYGNGTALFTTSGSNARQFQSEVDVGQVRFYFS